MQRFLTFWPLAVVIGLLVVAVGKISPQTLSVLPWKILVCCTAIYAAHWVDEFFAIDEDLARAIVYGATVIAFALAI